jgi:hypothetical protein
MTIRLLLICGILGAAGRWASGQATAASGDAARIYNQAAELLRADDAKNIMDPASSAASFSHYYAPLPDDWVKMEKQDYELHAQVRELFHEASQMQQADWPARGGGRTPYSYLNDCRNLANEISDAAEYQGLVLLDQPDAFGSCADLMHLSDLLRNQPRENLVRLLVAEGVDAADSNKLMLIIANAKITEDPQDLNDLPLATAGEWIGKLLDHPDANTEMDQAMKGEAAAAHEPMTKPQMNRLLETVNRVQTERDFAAMSLAAHVYQYKNGRWPSNLDELKTELPRVPVDPWGDGKQTLGYALIAHGLPDGSDRPLVYSRCWLKDGLFFRTDEPQYSFYNSDGSNLPVAQQKRGGQFRDVAAWVPREGTAVGPTTQALE